MRAVIFGYFIVRSHRRNAVPSDIAPTAAPVATADRHDRSPSVAHEPTERPHSRSATATPQRRELCSDRSDQFGGIVGAVMKNGHVAVNGCDRHRSRPPGEMNPNE
ncbi:hypothetical protein AB0M02_44310 [Actinoplanes sp. NPDC051861]|uniref:hypothetical protein n=1 Tax=Actinoplanes sp. NPDC051861 TaxID=3155170 RepID=UPI00342E927A